MVLCQRFVQFKFSFGFGGAHSPVDLTFVFLSQEVRDLEQSWIDRDLDRKRAR